MDAKRLRKHRISNLSQSILILTGMIALTGLLGWLIAGAQGLKWLLFISAIMLILGPRISPQIILRISGARPLSEYEVPTLFAALGQLTRQAELPKVPKLLYVPSNILNAFTVGNRKQAAIAITNGLLQTLDSRELIGVLAHEVSHIRNHDMWIMNLSDVVSRLTSMFSIIGQLLIIVNLPLIFMGAHSIPWLPILLLILAPTLTLLLQLALSRTREFDADLYAASLTGDPAGLASALRKMETYKGGLLTRLFFPRHRDPHPSILRTHPNTEERVKRLLSLVEHRPFIVPSRSLFDEDVLGIPPYFFQIHKRPRWRSDGLRYHELRI